MRELRNGHLLPIGHLRIHLQLPAQGNVPPAHLSLVMQAAVSVTGDELHMRAQGEGSVTATPMVYDNQHFIVGRVTDRCITPAPPVLDGQALRSMMLALLQAAPCA